MIELYYAGTPNGLKIAVMLEEVGLPYTVRMIDIFEGDQLTAEFGRINPNHKIPAIVDTDPPGGGGPFAVFESGAILQYLAEKTSRFVPKDPQARSRTLQWLTWQMASLGPMQGQASHFVRYAPPGNEYAIGRYVKELKRLLTILDNRLGESPYVAGDQYTIADMAMWPGRTTNLIDGCQTSDFPNVQSWFDRIMERPAVQRALNSETLKAPPKYMGRKQVLDAHEWSNMFGDRQHAAPVSLSKSVEREAGG